MSTAGFRSPRIPRRKAASTSFPSESGTRARRARIARHDSPRQPRARSMSRSHKPRPSQKRSHTPGVRAAKAFFQTTRVAASKRRTPRPILSTQSPAKTPRSQARTISGLISKRRPAAAATNPRRHPKQKHQQIARCRGPHDRFLMAFLNREKRGGPKRSRLADFHPNAARI